MRLNLMFLPHAPKKEAAIVLKGLARRWGLVGSTVLFAVGPCATACELKIEVPPDVPESRLPTVDDIVGLRYGETLSVSPDGRMFAVFVKQANAKRNEYCTGWFVGATDGRGLRFVGAGGRVGPKAIPMGHVTGDVPGAESRWSPDGTWLAYARDENGEAQIWRSRVQGGTPQQITRSSADVSDFEWSEDGRVIYFTTDEARAVLAARKERLEREGYNYDRDIFDITDFLMPVTRAPRTPSPIVWVVVPGSGEQRLATEAESEEYIRVRSRRLGGVETAVSHLNRDPVPTQSGGGATAWLERLGPLSGLSRVVARTSGSSEPRSCPADECVGKFRKLWWGEGGRILFWKKEGASDRVNAFYAWSPGAEKVSPILSLRDHRLRVCEQGSGERLICIAEAPDKPPHVLVIHLRTGAVRVTADLNPEFDQIRSGRIEAFEWSTPRFTWNEPGGRLAGIFSDRTHGYVLYPPDFREGQKYPVFVDAYVAQGFTPVGREHPLQVYAASGIVVVRLQLPVLEDVAARLGPNVMKELYSADLGFPYLTMLMESTLRGLDRIIDRGFVDAERIGIGGVSHGTFVPLYIVQKYDRFRAVSISGPGWSEYEYYWGTRTGREAIAKASGRAGYVDWKPKPEGQGREFWRLIDIAGHVEAIEAPILMNFAASESFGGIRLIRHMADAGKAYDAYIYPNETHLKWQPAHLRSILSRNLDWFRFWLQDYEDPDPEKAEQFARWGELRRWIAAARTSELLQRRITGSRKCGLDLEAPWRASFHC